MEAESGSGSQIESLFLRAVRLPIAERGPFLDWACAGNPDLRADLEDLLAHEPDGERLGAYRILHAIGRGGIGAVYLAVRDDDQYCKQVALKLVKPGMDTLDVLRRFRQERQILAGLDHPYIARLLDGGCTADGRPFLVMELVNGQPIAEYCRERNLPIDARCRLFLKVCEAVAFAHRKLVVHRDLKPANILITPEGAPKLLDFGLAKILDGAADAETTSAPFAPLTPEYASPEQIRGGPLSTATDIYSLGIILHELLTGQPPRRPAASAHWETAGNSAVTRPSSSPLEVPDPQRWRRKLQGDLDNIVLLALRPEVDRRYRSVDALAADIRNYLDHRPVLARPDSLWYRTAKFVRRRRYALLASAGVLAGLVSGMFIAIGEAHSAEAARRLALAGQAESLRAQQAADLEHRRAERQRDLAMASRQVADERVTQMVDLSDRSLSQVYSLMERLAGGMAARREMIGATLEFLEKLSADVGSDNRLRVALGKAYTRLGDIQSDPSGAAIGGWEGALKSYRAGSAILQDLLDLPAPGNAGLLAWLDLQEKIALLLGQMGHSGDAPALLRRAISVVGQRAVNMPGDKDLARRRGNLYLALSKETHPDLAGSRPFAETSVGILAALAARFPSDAEVRYDLSRAYTERGYLAVNLAGAEAAAGDYRSAVELREQLVREHPTDYLYRRALIGAYIHEAHIFLRLNRLENGRASYRQALVVAEAEAADPQNLQAAADYGSALLSMAALDEQTGHRDASLEGIRRSIGPLERVVAVAGHSPVALLLSDAYERVGSQLLRDGNQVEAVAQLRRAQSVADAYWTFYPGERQGLERLTDSSRTLIRALTLSGDRQSAFDQATALIRRLEQSRGSGSDAAALETSIAGAWLALAGVHRDFAEWEPARAAAQETVRHAAAAAQLFARDVPSIGSILEEAHALLAECSARLGADEMR